jgi:hypothetical protein
MIGLIFPDLWHRISLLEKTRLCNGVLTVFFLKNLSPEEDQVAKDCKAHRQKAASDALLQDGARGNYENEARYNRSTSRHKHRLF